MRTIIIILAAVLVIALFGCGQRMVEVQSGEIVICSQCGKVIHSDVQTEQVSNSKASNYTVEEIKSMCEDCAERKAKAEIATREKLEATVVLENLDATFSVGWIASEMGRETSIRPGGDIRFSMMVDSNRGSEPVSGLTWMVEPADQVVLVKIGGNSLTPTLDEETYRRHAALFRQLITTGVALKDPISRDEVLFPTDSPYYRANVLFRKTDDLTGGGFVDRLILSPNLQPGWDVQFRGYLMYQGHKKLINTVTVHVMYPQ